jgi:hypothetical protein
MVDGWPFADPENLATFTVEDVLTGTKPILYVSHDVSDGGWQFLTGEDLSESTPKLVCLADVVGLEPAIRELADLRLGWYAEREAPGAPWQRRPAYPLDFDELLKQAQDYTNACQERLKDEFSMLEWERYDYNQESATLIFSSNGVPRLTMKIQVAGSWSSQSNTWLWSWDNDSILPDAAESVHMLQTFGQQHGFERLASAYWPAEEVDAWEMTCIACLLLQGEGVYRAPDDKGALFMVVRDPELVQS